MPADADKENYAWPRVEACAPGGYCEKHLQRQPFRELQQPLGEAKALAMQKKSPHPLQEAGGVVKASPTARGLFLNPAGGCDQEGKASAQLMLSPQQSDVQLGVKQRQRGQQPQRAEQQQQQHAVLRPHKQEVTTRHGEPHYEFSFAGVTRSLISALSPGSDQSSAGSVVWQDSPEAAAGCEGCTCGAAPLLAASFSRPCLASPSPQCESASTSCCCGGGGASPPLLDRPEGWPRSEQQGQPQQRRAPRPHERPSSAPLLLLPQQQRRRSRRSTGEQAARPQPSEASIYERGAAWLARKRCRDKALREQALHDEVSRCTFHPAVSSTSRAAAAAAAGTPPELRRPRAVTPDRARQLFERQLRWRQRLDDEAEQLRRAKAEAEAAEALELQGRGPTAAAASRTPRSSRGTGGSSSAHEALPSDALYERGKRWQRDKDERLAQMQEEDLLRTIATPGRSPRTPRLLERSACGWATGCCEQEVWTTTLSSPAALHMQRVLGTDIHKASRACGPAGTARVVEGGANVFAPSPSSAAQLHMPHVVVTSRAAAAGTTPGGDEAAAAAPDEKEEVATHLAALRQHLATSAGRSAVVRSSVGAGHHGGGCRGEAAAGWQRALRVEVSRLHGAGAAPLAARGPGLAAATAAGRGGAGAASQVSHQAAAGRRQRRPISQPASLPCGRGPPVGWAPPYAPSTSFAPGRRCWRPSRSSSRLGRVAAEPRTRTPPYEPEVEPPRCAPPRPEPPPPPRPQSASPARHPPCTSASVAASSSSRIAAGAAGGPAPVYKATLRVTSGSLRRMS